METLLGDARKAKDKLGWIPETTLEELVKEMIDCDKLEAQKQSAIERIYGK